MKLPKLTHEPIKEDLKALLADIWRYCTHDWLRVCDKGSTTNQARWKSKDYWSLIAFIVGKI